MISNSAYIEDSLTLEVDPVRDSHTLLRSLSIPSLRGLSIQKVVDGYGNQRGGGMNEGGDANEW